jgi:hypothetical protein
VNGGTKHPLWIALAIGVAGFLGGVVWSLHANDAAQTSRLDEFERRAEVARSSIVDGLERLASIERDVALIKQRLEARP